MFANASIYRVFRTRYIRKHCTGREDTDRGERDMCAVVHRDVPNKR